MLHVDYYTEFEQFSISYDNVKVAYMLSLDDGEGCSFTEDDENILQILAYCIGQIMEKSSLENQLRAQQKQTNALHQIVGLNSLT